MNQRENIYRMSLNENSQFNESINKKLDEIIKSFVKFDDHINNLPETIFLNKDYIYYETPKNRYKRIKSEYIMKLNEIIECIDNNDHQNIKNKISYIDGQLLATIATAFDFDYCYDILYKVTRNDNIIIGKIKCETNSDNIVEYCKNSISDISFKHMIINQEINHINNYFRDIHCQYIINSQQQNN